MTPGRQPPHEYGWEQNEKQDFYSLTEEESAYYDALDGEAESRAVYEPGPELSDEDTFIAAETGPFYVGRPKFLDPTENAPKPINTSYVPDWHDADYSGTPARRSKIIGKHRKKSKDEEPVDDEFFEEDDDPLTPAQRSRRRLMIICIIGAVGIIATVAILYFGVIRPRGSYDAQMQIGLAKYKDKDYEAAEKAYNKALEYKPGDVAAILGLSDVYVGWEKYDEAIKQLTGLIAEDEKEARAYNRLLSIYVEHTDQIAEANALIMKCYELGVDPESSLIAAAPKFDPGGGTYNQEIAVSISGPEGYTIYFTNDGTQPNGTDVGIPFTEALPYKSKTPITVKAIGVNEKGLISWPSEATYIVEIHYVMDTQPAEMVATSANEIISKMGALFYVGTREDGHYYRDESSTYLFGFPIADFGVDSDDKPNDPEKTPLPAASVCFAVEMDADTLFPQIYGSIGVDELMAGIDITDYSVNDNGGGSWSLVFWSGGVRYHFALESATSIAYNDTVRVSVG